MTPRHGAPLRVDVRILDERVRSALPAYATEGSAGMDLRACIEAPLTLAPGDAYLVPTGIAIHVADPGYAALIPPAPGSATSTASCSATWSDSSTPTTRDRCW